MKIGTDSVLLGCLCDAVDAKKILDIGTGTGLLALMMAQKSEAEIDAVEIDAAAFEEALYNVNASPWAHRIKVFHQRIQDFKLKENLLYDLIIANPPYYLTTQNRSIDDVQRSKARHDEDLTFVALLETVNRLLKSDGVFWLVLPVAEAEQFKQLAQESSLFLQQQITIQSKASKSANRMVMCLGKKQCAVQSKSFTIYEEDGTPTDAYINLTRSYYLWKQFDQDERLKI